MTPTITQAFRNHLAVFTLDSCDVDGVVWRAELCSQVCHFTCDEWIEDGASWVTRTLREAIA